MLEEIQPTVLNVHRKYLVFLRLYQDGFCLFEGENSIQNNLEQATSIDIRNECLMRVLYVTGSCLTNNTSANLSHNGYIKGLIENGCQVDIIMAETSWGDHDETIPRWEAANYFVYNNQNIKGRIRSKYHKVQQNSGNLDKEVECGSSDATGKMNNKSAMLTTAKKLFNNLLPDDPIYPLEKTWLKKARKYKSKDRYDLVISNSSPAASHKMVAELLGKKRIFTDRWIQIWEDPWTNDIYQDFSQKIFDEEHNLLRLADEIYYVSPLTLKYQKEYFPDCATKMKHIPLPYFSLENRKTERVRDIDFGYFGDYFSKSRNLIPFYESVSKSNFSAQIYGDSDLDLEHSNRLKISGRVTLDQLSDAQERTKVLVHLCNLSGGQIPGKIYHYSSTDKPILFILDGTEEEQKEIFDYFKQFNRYYFVQNNYEQIADALDRMIAEYGKKVWNPVEAFDPVNIVKRLISGQKSTGTIEQ